MIKHIYARSGSCRCGRSTHQWTNVSWYCVARFRSILFHKGGSWERKLRCFTAWQWLWIFTTHEHMLALNASGYRHDYHKKNYSLSDGTIRRSCYICAHFPITVPRMQIYLVAAQRRVLREELCAVFVPAHVRLSWCSAPYRPCAHAHLSNVCVYVPFIYHSK